VIIQSCFVDCPRVSGTKEDRKEYKKRRRKVMLLFLSFDVDSEKLHQVRTKNNYTNKKIIN
jgi:hypothetical protein